MPTLVVLLRHVEDVLRVDDVLADIADGRPPHVCQQLFNFLGDTTIHETQLVGLDPYDELRPDGFESRLVGDEGTPPSKNPSVGVEVSLDGEERRVRDELRRSPDAMPCASEPSRGRGMSVLGYEGGEFGAVDVVAVDGTGYLWQVLIYMEIKPLFVVTIGALARGTPGERGRGGTVGRCVRVVVWAWVVSEDVKEMMHGSDWILERLE